MTDVLPITTVRGKIWPFVNAEASMALSAVLYENFTGPVPVLRSVKVYLPKRNDPAPDR